MAAVEREYWEVLTMGGVEVMPVVAGMTKEQVQVLAVKRFGHVLGVQRTTRPGSDKLSILTRIAADAARQGFRVIHGTQHAPTGGNGRRLRYITIGFEE
jgi:hypothetical protein